MTDAVVSNVTLRELMDQIDQGIARDQLINILAEKNIINADDVNKITRLEDLHKLQELVLVLLGKGEQFNALASKVLDTVSSTNPNCDGIDRAIEKTTGKRHEGRLVRREPRILCTMDLSEDWHLKNFLENLSQKIGHDDFKSLKDILLGENGFSASVMEKHMDRPFALFRKLMTTRRINSYNLLYLQALLRRIRRMDLVEDVREFCIESGKKPVHFFIPATDPEPGHRYVTFHVEGNLENLTLIEIERLRLEVSNVLIIPLEYVVIAGITPANSLMFTFMVPEVDLQHFISIFDSKRDAILACHVHLSVEVTTDDLQLSELTANPAKDDSAALMHLGNLLQREQKLQKQLDDQDEELYCYKKNFLDAKEQQKLAKFHQAMSKRLLELLKTMEPKRNNIERIDFSRSNLADVSQRYTDLLEEARISDIVEKSLMSEILDCRGTLEAAAQSERMTQMQVIIDLLNMQVSDLAERNEIVRATAGVAFGRSTRMEDILIMHEQAKEQATLQQQQQQQQEIPGAQSLVQSLVINIPLQQITAAATGPGILTQQLQQIFRTITMTELTKKERGRLKSQMDFPDAVKTLLASKPERLMELAYLKQPKDAKTFMKSPEQFVNDILKQFGKQKHVKKYFPPAAAKEHKPAVEAKQK